MDRHGDEWAYASNHTSSGNDARSELSQPHAAPLRGFDPLAIVPSLVGIPLSHRVGSTLLEKVGRLGVEAMRAGIVIDDDLRSSVEPEEILTNAIKCRVLEEAQKSGLKVSVRVDFTGSDIETHDEHPADTTTFVACNLIGDPDIRVIAPFVTELECQLEGLGECLMYCLSVALEWSSSAYTPTSMLETISRYHWCGCENEEEYIDCFADEECEIEAVITLEEIERKTPAWMFRFKSTSEYEEILSSALRYGIADPELIAAASSILSMLSNFPENRLSINYQKVEHSFYIRANDNDHLFRFADEDSGYLMEGSEGIYSTNLWALPTDRTKLAQWRTELEYEFSLFRKAIGLMKMMTVEGVYSHGSEHFDE